MLPPDIRQEMVAKFIRMEANIPNNANPIKRVEVLAAENQGTVNFDEIPNDLREGGGIGIAGGLRSTAQWRTAMYAKASTSQVRITEIQQLQVAKHAEIERRLKKIEAMVRSINIAPAHQGAGGWKTRIVIETLLLVLLLVVGTNVQQFLIDAQKLLVRSGRNIRTELVVGSLRKTLLQERETEK